MGKYTRTADEVKEMFWEQVRFLIKSCNEFDQGDEAEAVRIAGCLRTLLHDTDKSKSAAGLIGLKDMNLGFCDTSETKKPYRSRNASTIVMTFSKEYLGLVYKDINGYGADGYPVYRFVPLFHLGADMKIEWKTFSDWWSYPVYVTAYDVRFSRADVVLHLTNKDGYAHIDPKFDMKYLHLRDRDVLKIRFDSVPVHFSNYSSHATVRQIAEEFILSLVDEFPEEVKVVRNATRSLLVSCS